MKWWGLIVAKAVVLIALHLLLVEWAHFLFPGDRLGRDLNYTFFLLGVDIFVFVLGYAAWFDQKYRCRVCLARLRMPLTQGDWAHATLIAPPQLEWICPRGHGALRQEEFQLGGGKPDRWTPNDSDFWRAFEDAWRRN